MHNAVPGDGRAAVHDVPGVQGSVGAATMTVMPVK